MCSIKYLEDNLKSRYLFELERKDKISNGATIPITIFTFLCGAIIYYLNNPINQANDCIGLIFKILTIIVSKTFYRKLKIRHLLNIFRVRIIIFYWKIKRISS